MEETPASALHSLTTEIVSSYVACNSISIRELSGLINSTYSCLASLDKGAPAPDVATPAVPIKKSVKTDVIICLVCGKPMKMLKRHLATDHGLSIEQYKAKFNLPADYPVVAPSYAARRSELAIKVGLGRKPAGKAKR